MKIVFVGLSNKINTKPLDSSTISGALIDEIINGLMVESIKTNLVNFAPLDINGKLRYPNQQEKNDGKLELQKLIIKYNPKLIVCLGDIVYRYIGKEFNNVIKIKHPAYIAVYRRREKDQYVKDVIKLINNNLKYI